MKRINNGELKQLQIDILDEVDRFCKQHNINYWLDCGTLLGAIRHEGFIPWDNDLDIGMLREDYDKFCKMYNKFDNTYELHCYENDENFFFPFAKIYNTKTVLYEPDIKGDRLSVNIDVFAYDNAPIREKDLKKMYKKRDFLYLCNFHYRANNEPLGNSLRKLAIKTFRKLIKLFPRRMYVMKLVDNAKKYQFIESGNIGDFTSIGTIIADKSIFSEFIERRFEGGLYPVPKRYDEWLRIVYGDYMKIPPKEEQIVHSFEAFYLDDN